ncbi:PadR family transcriptional regulator [Butyricicoccus faecihominis]|uniref:PadR family transcriptional regulator n=1 Tax=Butyricicoccaceae TaxID=3085642 RepID=UPI00247A6B25|nr:MULTISPECIES: PadR family transcriptional regulator [Butyricicoccaceae]MCQ5130802.1 PadR family transcriptional regulator [Butyricicoccus faecihominis]WNX85204.1 PadR family transcriptional regulator [Agathobaculum sp. NTUH-O15-33]
MSYPIASSLLDGIVLSVVERESTYGYRITQEIQQVIEISESTLYPVLRRLLKDGYLTTYDEAYAGRNRRYYRITEHGRARLRQHRIDWQNYRNSIDHIFFGGQAS